MLTARDIMTEDVVTIRPTASIREATELMLRARVSGMPVVDGQGRLAGIISEFALLATAYDRKVMGDVIANHMTSDVVSIDVDEPIRKVADLFIVHRVRRMPVLEKGQLVGIIARRDVLQAVYDTQPVEAAR